MQLVAALRLPEQPAKPLNGSGLYTCRHCGAGHEVIVLFNKFICSLALTAALTLPATAQMSSTESGLFGHEFTGNFHSGFDGFEPMHFFSEEELKINGLVKEAIGDKEDIVPAPDAENPTKVIDHQNKLTDSQTKLTDSQTKLTDSQTKAVNPQTKAASPQKKASVAKAKKANKYNMPSIKVHASGVVYKRVPLQDHRRRSMASRGAHASPTSAHVSPTGAYKTVAVRQPMDIDITPIICKYSEKYHLDPWLVRAIIQVESNFRPTAGSYAGAGGLMQLMPSTAYSLGCKDRFDPESNIAAGTRYLRQMINIYPDNMSLALAAYNAGPGNVQRYGGIPPFAETRNYVHKVTTIWKGTKAKFNP